MFDNAMRQAFAEEEKRFRLPSGTLTAMYGIESNFGRAKDRPGSQYQGPFQLGRDIRRQYGVTNPADWRQSLHAAAAYAGNNADILRNKLGRDPNGPEIYMAHQQGAGGASALLANPNAPAGSLVNPRFIRANGGDPNAPASAFTGRFGSKYDNYVRAATQGAGPSVPMQPGPPAPGIGGASGSGVPTDVTPNPMHAAMNAPPAAPPVPEQGGGGGFLEALQGLFGGEGKQSFGNALGNIADRLGGVGVALMSIDNPQGAAAMASAMRNNQRAAGKQFRGFAPNGKGMIFTDANGNVEIQPVPEAYQGPKENNLPAEVVAAQYFKEHPDDLKTLQAMRGKEGPIGENGQYKYQFPVKDLDKAIERMSAGEKLTMNDKQFKRDLNHRLTERDIDPREFGAGTAAQAGRMAEFRRYADITSRIDALVPGFQADISAARKAIDDYKKIAGDGSIVPLNRLLAAGTEAFSGPGAAELARARETLKTTIDRFAAIQGQGRLTEASRKEALQLLSPYMQQGVSSSVLDSMETMATRTRDNNRKTRANMEARMRNKELPYPELEGSPESAPAAPQNDKSAPSMPEGVKQAPDGNWYVEKDGKFYRVKQPK